MKNFKLFIVLFIGITSQAFAYKTPLPEWGETVVIALSDEQLHSLIPIKNYGIPSSPDGICFGIDRTNYTLLTLIDFVNATPNTPEEIQWKIEAAFEGHMRQTIYGYRNLKSFMNHMVKTWNDWNNPLRRAAESIQLKQSIPQLLGMKVMRTAEYIFSGSQTVLNDAIAFKSYIDEGVPLKISITDSWGSHALTIVGYKMVAGERFPLDFYVLDSNDPSTLKLVSIGVFHHPNGQRGTGWFFSERIGNAMGGFVYLYWKRPAEFEIRAAQQTFETRLLLVQ